MGSSRHWGHQSPHDCRTAGWPLRWDAIPGNESNQHVCVAFDLGSWQVLKASNRDATPGKVQSKQNTVPNTADCWLLFDTDPLWAWSDSSYSCGSLTSCGPHNSLPFKQWRFNQPKILNRRRLINLCPYDPYVRGVGQVTSSPFREAIHWAKKDPVGFKTGRTSISIHFGIMTQTDYQILQMSWNMLERPISIVAYKTQLHPTISPSIVGRKIQFLAS